MPFSLSPGPGKAFARTVGLAAAAFVFGPAAAHASTFCVANPGGVQCPASFDYKETSFTDLKADLTDQDASSTVQVEPGTYSDYDLDGPSDLDIQGDPAQAAYPTITSSGSTPAVTVTQKSEGVHFSHLTIEHAGNTPGTALYAVNEFSLDHVYLDSNGAALVHAGTHGSDTLNTVVATSTAPGTSAASIPLIQTNTSETQTWTDLYVYAKDRVSGVVARAAGVTNITRMYSDAEGVVNGKSGSALAFIGADPGGLESRNPNVTLHQAELHGGSFGLGAYSTQLHGFDVLATSDGVPPEQIKVGALDDVNAALVDNPLPPAGVGVGAASNLTLLNFTAFASAPGSDGIVANSAGGNEDGNGFDYAAFVTIQNSIMRGPRADAEVLDGANTNSQQGLVATDHDNFVTAVGSIDNITHGQTVTVGDTDQIDDPMFVNPVASPTGDFHVKPGSRTLQAAGFIPAGDLDLDGNTRPSPSGTAGDLGAYESTAAPAGPGTPPVVANPSNGGSGGSGSGSGGGGGAGSGGGGGGAGSGAGGTPAPQKPSNVFTIGGATIAKDGTITLSLKAPGPGTFAVTASTTVSKKVGHKTKSVKVIFGSATAAAVAGTPVSAAVKPGSAVSSSLNKGKKLKVAVTVTFTPVGGTPASLGATVTVKKKK